MKTIRIISGVAALFVLSGCGDLSGPSFNDPSVEDLTENPTPAAVAAVAQGLLASQRGLTSSFVTTLGIWGREAYVLCPEEPRCVADNLTAPIFREGNYWGGQYDQLQNAFLLLDMIEKVEGLSDAEKEAVRGFTKTLMAEAFFQVILMHEPYGAPIDVNREPGSPLAPIEPADAVYQHLFDLYDEAATHLQAAGGSFPFQFPLGLADFNTPASFLMVNRALKVRALKYRDRWTDVLNTLAQTFIDDNAPLSFGAYHSYSTNAGDQSNGLANDPDLYAHPRLVNGAQLRANGEIDLRAQNKLAPVDTLKLQGIVVSEVFTVYDGLSAPLPWITNEELILIRAEANLALGNTSDAIDDINIVRVQAGGLEPIPDPYSGDLLQELLYNKRYSLMLEGGFTFLDARQYSRMGDNPDELPRLNDTHVVYRYFGFPEDECQARDILEAPPCRPIPGF